MNVERRPVKHEAMPFYTVGRSYLLDFIIASCSLCQGQNCRWTRRAYEQLTGLQEAGRTRRQTNSHPASELPKEKLDTAFGEPAVQGGEVSLTPGKVSLKFLQARHARERPDWLA